MLIVCRCCFLLLLFIFSMLHAQAQSSNFRKVDDTWYTSAARITIADLPPEIFATHPEVNPPSLVLDGTTLVIGQPGTQMEEPFRFKDLTLKGGAKIITNGADLTFSFEELRSKRGSIQSFENQNAQVEQASDGANGRDGIDGGHLILDGAIARDDTLIVNLSGQNGQKGGQGRPGYSGAPGVSGDNAADHLFDCAHGGGQGGRGSPGQNGQPGQRGGRGGNGGNLTLRRGIAVHLDQVQFTSLGGFGGDGGPGGTGGQGGPGGSGGSGSTYCGGGPTGPQGEHGAYGVAGQPGANGASGQIFLQPGG